MNIEDILNISLYNLLCFNFVFIVSFVEVCFLRPLQQTSTKISATDRLIGRSSVPIGYLFYLIYLMFVICTEA